MGKCECGRLKGNPCGPLRPNTINVTMPANGQEARYIEELFPGTDASDFVGSVRCTAPGEGMFTGVAVELDAGSRIFTTLPVVPVQR